MPFSQFYFVCLFFGFTKTDRFKLKRCVCVTSVLAVCILLSTLSAIVLWRNVSRLAFVVSHMYCPRCGLVGERGRLSWDICSTLSCGEDGQNVAPIIVIGPNPKVGQNFLRTIL